MSKDKWEGRIGPYWVIIEKSYGIPAFGSPGLMRVRIATGEEKETYEFMEPRHT